MAIRYERADVVVLGGGWMGCWAALQARRRGLSCILVDRARPVGFYPALPLSPALSSSDDWTVKAASLQALRALEQDLGTALLREDRHWLIAPQESERFQEAGRNLELHRQGGDLLSPGQLAQALPQLRPSTEVWGLEEKCWWFAEPQLLARFWQLLQKLEVEFFVDTEILHCDLEYDQPTAVSHEMALRGRYLWLAESALAGAAGWPEVERHSDDLLPLEDQPASPSHPPLPNLSVLFREHIVRLEHLQLSESRQVERPQESLERFRSQWLPQARPLAMTKGPDFSVSEKVGALYHPWREDALATVGLGREGCWRAPGLAQLGLARLLGLAGV